MQYSKLIAVFITTTLLIACKKENEPGIPETSLTLRECSNLGSNSLPLICFDSLVTDSRCPANAICIWQGVVVVKLSLIDDSSLKSFYLSSFKNNGSYPPNDTTIDGYKIKLINVTYKVLPGDGALLPQVALLVNK